MDNTQALFLSTTQARTNNSSNNNNNITTITPHHASAPAQHHNLHIQPHHDTASSHQPHHQPQSAALSTSTPHVVPVRPQPQHHTVPATSAHQRTASAAVPDRSRDAPTPDIQSPVTSTADGRVGSRSSSSPGPRVPLSSIVSVLVDEWSRSYTVEALKGDVESMCMLAQGHFSRNGWGCIPHDTQRGHDWLARAKQTMIDAAAVEAKRLGRKPCKVSTHVKAQELEEQCLTHNVFELEDTGAPLDDHMSSSESITSLNSFSCDAEGGDTAGSFIANCETGAYASMESDGGGSFYSSAPPSACSSVRNSVSHPNLFAAWGGKASARVCSPIVSTEALYTDGLLRHSTVDEHDDESDDACSAPELPATAPGDGASLSAGEYASHDFDASFLSTASGSQQSEGHDDGSLILASAPVSHSNSSSEADSGSPATHVAHAELPSPGMASHDNKDGADEDAFQLPPQPLRRAISASN